MAFTSFISTLSGSESDLWIINKRVFNGFSTFLIIPGFLHENMRAFGTFTGKWMQYVHQKQVHSRFFVNFKQFTDCTTINNRFV